MTYQIKLITPKGIVTEEFTEGSKPLEEFTKDMVNKYGTFVMLSSNPIQ